ncbi:hypothetical protein D3C78_1100840 [compost metagenome]
MLFRQAGGGDNRLQRRLELHQQRVGIDHFLLIASQIVRSHCRIGAGINADHVLAFSINKNQRYAGRVFGNRLYRLGINAIGSQLLTNAFADVISAHAGDKSDIRAAAPCRHRLVGAFAAKRHFILLPDHRFTRTGKLLNIKDMVGIDTAQNHQLTCCHRIDS